jgi:hypothetical protein
MAHVRGQCGLSVGGTVAGLFLAGALVGCGSPGEGSISVSSESRARLLPHAGATAKDAKGKAIANKPMSSKELVRGKGPEGSQ